MSNLRLNQKMADFHLKQAEIKFSRTLVQTVLKPKSHILLAEIVMYVPLHSFCLEIDPSKIEVWFEIILFWN